MSLRWFWSAYSWVFWHIPSKRRRWRLILLEACRENKFTSRIKAISDQKWLERLAREVKE